MASTHVVEQLSFSMFPSIPTFDFGLISGSNFTFWALMGISGVGIGLKHCYKSNNKAELLFTFYVSFNSDI